MFLFFSVHSYCRSSSFKRFTFLKIVRMKCLYLFWHEASIHLLRFAGFSYLLLFGRAWMFLPPEHLESSEQKRINANNGQPFKYFLTCHSPLLQVLPQGDQCIRGKVIKGHIFDTSFYVPAEGSDQTFYVKTYKGFVWRNLNNQGRNC